jgi:hypothetical protein
MFEILWPQLNTELEALRAQLGGEPAKRRSSGGKSSLEESYGAMLEEMLELMRTQVRITSSPEELLPMKYLQSALDQRVDRSLPPPHSKVWRDLEQAMDLAKTIEQIYLDEPVPPGDFKHFMSELRRPVQHLLKRVGRGARGNTASRLVAAHYGSRPSALVRDSVQEHQVSTDDSVVSA